MKYALLVLIVMAVVDGALSGMRAAVGRNPRVALGRWFRKAGLRGGAIAALVVAAVAAVGARSVGEVPQGVLDEVVGRAVTGFGLLTSIMLVLGAVWLVGGEDVRVFVVALVLGPVAALRPSLCLIAAGWALGPAFASGHVELVFLGAVVVAGILGLGPVLRATWYSTVYVDGFEWAKKVKPGA